MRHSVEVYEDVDPKRGAPGNSIGVRGDGYVTAIFGTRLEDWREYGDRYSWKPPEDDLSKYQLARRGRLLGRLEYDEPGDVPTTAF